MKFNWGATIKEHFQKKNICDTALLFEMIEGAIEEAKRKPTIPVYFKKDEKGNLVEVGEIRELAGKIVKWVREHYPNHYDGVELKHKEGVYVVKFTNFGNRRTRDEVLRALRAAGVVTDLETRRDQPDEGFHRAKTNFFVKRRRDDKTYQPATRSVIIQLDAGGPNATAFEVNLLNAINFIAGCSGKPESGQGSDLEGSTYWQDRANKIIEKLDDSALKGGCYKKSVPGTLSAIYSGEGVTDRTPKADIISEDEQIRISIKNWTRAQFVTAQRNEANAIYSAVTAVAKTLLQEDPTVADLVAAAENAEAVLRSSGEFFQGPSIKYLETSAEIEQYKKTREELRTALFALPLRELIVREAMLGEKKFKDERAVPNYFLIWDANDIDNSEFKTADHHIKDIAPNVNLDIRGRGRPDRSLSLRGYTYNKPN